MFWAWGGKGGKEKVLIQMAYQREGKRYAPFVKRGEKEKKLRAFDDNGIIEKEGERKSRL